MLHEPCRAVGGQSTLLHAVQHGGVSCMGITNPPLALSGHARQFRAETLCSAKRGKGKGVRGALPHGGWDRVLDFVLTHVLIALTMSAARSWGRHHAFKKCQHRKNRRQELGALWRLEADTSPDLASQQQGKSPADRKL